MVDAEYLKTLEKRRADIDEILNKLKSAEGVEPKIDIQEGISKRIAAIEVWKHLNRAKMASALSIGGFLVVGLCFTFGILAGSIAALIFSFGFGFYMFSVIREQKRLEFLYNINPKVKF